MYDGLQFHLGTATWALAAKSTFTARLFTVTDTATSMS
jgi:hypothetical protein